MDAVHLGAYALGPEEEHKIFLCVDICFFFSRVRLRTYQHPCNTTIKFLLMYSLIILFVFLCVFDGLFVCSREDSDQNDYQDPI